MKLSQFVLALIIGSIILISCGKDNELTPNPIFDPDATNQTSNNNNGGGNNNDGSGNDDGTIVGQGLKGVFGGKFLNVNNCYFRVDSDINLTNIEATKSDSSITVNFVISETVTTAKTYQANDALLSITYDLNASIMELFQNLLQQMTI